jgi:hypothetical protein
VAGTAALLKEGRARAVKRWLHRIVLRNRLVTFIVMCLSFFAFGVVTLNLFFLMQANANLLLEHGWLALMDGGLQQLAELLGSGFVAMVAYLLFKVCEQRLVSWLATTTKETEP